MYIKTNYFDRISLEWLINTKRVGLETFGRGNDDSQPRATLTHSFNDS